MPFSQEAGYTPSSIETIMLGFMANINTQFGTTYTAESFIGTNHYKFFYAQAQLLQQGDIKTSEIFLKLQQYITIQNERISRPVVTNPGTIEKLESEGFISSVKPMIEVDAGKRHICVDVDDGVHSTGSIEITSFANLVSGTDDSITVGATVFTAQTGAATPGAGTFQAATSNEATAISLAAQINAHATIGALVWARAVGAFVSIEAKAGGEDGDLIALVYTNNDANVGAIVSAATLEGGEDNEDYPATRLEICEILSDCVVGGVVTIGTETETIVLTNGQAFDWSFNLPQRIPIQLRLTINLSENNEVVIASPDVTRQLLLTNIRARYRLGKNFEPQRYFAQSDAPWSASVLLEWAEVSDTPTWSNAIFDADYDELFDIALDRITLVET